MAFECDICGNEYDSKQALGGHKSVAHSKKRCKYCGANFAPHVLKKHQNACSKKPSISDCDNCGSKHDETYGSGRFCCEACARSFATKKKRQEINEKVSETLYGKGRDRVELTCDWCSKSFVVRKSKSGQNYCSKSCAQKSLWSDDDYREQMLEKLGVRDIDLEERKRLRDIGRKGGFGKSGKTDFGVRYESLLEKKCFELLYEENVNFKPHPEIPGTSRVSDAYIPSKDIYVEIDGIDRSRLKNNDNLDWFDRWRSKMKLYNKLDLDVKVVKSKKELKDFIAP